MTRICSSCFKEFDDQVVRCPVCSGKNYADLLSRVKEARRIFESNKDKYQADVNSGVAGLAYMDVVDTIDRLIPEAKEEGK